MAGERKVSEEIWKDIEGFPNYQISNRGKVRNKETLVVIAQQLSASGYMTVRIRRRHGDYEKPCLNVHRLVAEAFIPGGSSELQVNHKDGNKLNNNAENLEWCTRKENSQHAMKMGLFNPKAPESPKRKVRIVETGETFNSIRDCAKEINVKEQHVWACLNGKRETRNGLHFEYADDNCNEINRLKKQQGSILYGFQYEAVDKAFNGCIFNGGTGTGKSRTGLYFYFKEQGGSYVGSDYIPMKKPKDLYIITPAVKRDKGEWSEELSLFRLSEDSELNYYDNKVVVDSWNNIGKYIDVIGAYFIFDECKINGGGAWTKHFLKITKNNDWIMLSATAGDRWIDYWPVFVANGFYKNKTEFVREHVVYSQYCKNFPKIDHYINTQRLMRLRDKILIDMEVQRHTVPHDEDVYCNYDIQFYKDVFKRRWDPYKDEPVKQASELCYVLRKIVNSDESRQTKLLELLEDHPKAIIFYSYDYERDILLNLGYSPGTKIAEWTGHKHEPVPEGDEWVYLVNYASGAEGFCCISTDTVIFYSQTYSYKTLIQSKGRVDRLNTKFIDLYYYHLKSRSGIDLAISRALKEKKKFNEQRWVDSWK